MKIFVFGCSFSDYLENNRTVWGLELARKLGCEYHHEGRGTGSNWRMWRRCVSLVQSGEITPEDLVLVQYSGLERREFWSDHQVPNKDGTEARESAYEGDIIRYKALAWTWMHSPIEIKFLRLYEEHFVNTDFEREIFHTQHLMFQETLKARNIPTVFIDGRHTSVRPLPLIQPFDQWVFHEPREFMEDRSSWYSKKDNSHLSDLGHGQLAELVGQHLRSLKLVE